MSAAAPPLTRSGPPGAPEALEVRAFFGAAGQAREDPVTGSLNASVAQWLLARGVLDAPYIARHGTAMGRAGRVHISRHLTPWHACNRCNVIP